MEITKINNFGALLMQIRKEKNLSRQEVATMFGVSRNQIYKIETGVVKSVSPTVLKILQHFKPNVGYADGTEGKQLIEVKKE